MYNKRKEYAAAFLIISIIGLLFVTLSGSLFSGYHFMDCHVFTKCKQGLASMPWWEYWVQCVKGEWGLRFRPVWHLNTLLETWLWGDDLLWQGLWQIGQVIVDAFLVYLLGRRLQQSHGVSLLLAGLTLIGTQSAIFYQTLAIETTGLLLLLLSWHCLLIYTKMGGKTLYYSAFTIISILLAFIKENFILALPAGYCFYCMVYAQKHQTGFIKTLLETWKTGVFLALTTIAGLGAVLAFVGMDFGYAGIDFHLAAYVKSAFYLYGISGILLVLPFVGWLLWRKKVNGTDWLYPVLLFAAITVPQVIIYAKSNIIDRYLIPAVMGCALLSVFVYGELKKNDVAVRLRLWRYIAFVGGGMLVGLCGLVVFHDAFRQGILDFTVRLQGERLQEMTSVSSVQYLSATIRTMGVTALLAGCVLLAGGCWHRKRTVTTLSQLYMVGLLLWLLLNGGLAFASHQRYAMRGVATENFLQTIIRHTATNDTILIVGNPVVEIEGATAGISTYLHKYGRGNLFICPVTRAEVEKAMTASLTDFYPQDIDAIADKDNIKAIALFPGLEALFAQSNPWFDAVLFHRYAFAGNYVVFTRK